MDRIKETIRRWLLQKLGGVDIDIHLNERRTEYELGFADGTKQAKTHLRFLPLPFTEEQLRGADYGTFVTPAGFASSFGECNIPAPGPHGYEMRAYYTYKNSLNLAPDLPLPLYPSKAFANPADSDALVPVILVVLR